jgi:uncharacterized protein (TIRG00374 family)
LSDIIEDSHNSANQTSKSLTRRVIPGLLLGLLVFIILILVGDLQQVSSQVRNFRWSLFPLVLGLTLWNYLLRFFKWHYFLGQVGVEGYPIRKSLRLFVAGFPLAVTPGKVGETLKGVWLNQETGIPTPRGVSVVLAERISDGLAMIVLSTTGIIAYRRYWPVFAIVLGLLLGVIIISQIRPLAARLLDLGERIPFVGKYSHSLREFYEGSFTLFRPKVTFISVGLGTISWLAEGIGFYLVLIGLGTAPGSKTLAISVFILAFSTVIGAVTALPGGLLATDASIAGMLVLLLNFDANTAAAATLIIRFATLWFGVGLGLIVWPLSTDLLGFSQKR